MTFESPTKGNGEGKKGKNIIMSMNINEVITKRKTVITYVHSKIPTGSVTDILITHYTHIRPTAYKSKFDHKSEDLNAGKSLLGEYLHSALHFFIISLTSADFKPFIFLVISTKLLIASV